MDALEHAHSFVNHNPSPLYWENVTPYAYLTFFFFGKEKLVGKRYDGMIEQERQDRLFKNKYEIPLKTMPRAQETAL